MARAAANASDTRVILEVAKRVIQLCIPPLEQPYLPSPWLSYTPQLAYMSFLSRIQDQARQVDANRYLDEIFRLHVEVTDNEPRLIFIRVIQMTGQKGYRLLRARTASRCMDDEDFHTGHIPEMANRPVSQIPEVRATLAISISVVICDVGEVRVQLFDVFPVAIETTIAQQTRTLLAIG